MYHFVNKFIYFFEKCMYFLCKCWINRAWLYLETAICLGHRWFLTIQFWITVNHWRHSDQNLPAVSLHHQLELPSRLLYQLPCITQRQVLCHCAIDLKSIIAIRYLLLGQSDVFWCSEMFQNSDDIFWNWPLEWCLLPVGFHLERPVLCWSSL